MGGAPQLPLLANGESCALGWFSRGSSRTIQPVSTLSSMSMMNSGNLPTLDGKLESGAAGRLWTIVREAHGKSEESLPLTALRDSLRWYLISWACAFSKPPSVVAHADVRWTGGG